MDQSNFTPENLSTQHSPLPEGCQKGGVLKQSTSISEEFYIINEVKIKHQPIITLPYNKNLKDRAKALRYAENLTEVLFWMQVTKRRFHKIDFDRQRIIGNYIVDFYNKKLGLIVEIDGSSHDDKEIYDQIREEYFISLGLKVYRIAVDDVMKNMDFVLMGLEDYIIEQYG